MVRFGLDDIGVIKIDVESLELEVLQGMRNTIAKQRPIITCEILGMASGKPLDIMQKCNAEIYEIIAALEYKIYNIIKSEDNRKVIGLSEIGEFPNVHWSEEARESFDYLFVPKEKIGAVLSDF